jgi:hypothetical protein
VIEIKMFDGRLALVDPASVTALVMATPQETEEFKAKCHLYLVSGGPFSSKDSYATVKKVLEAALTK